MGLEILFQGKRIDNNEWVEGLPCYGGGLYPDSIETREGNVYGVDPYTIRQFTGYTDKNCKKIFKGDVFHFEDDIIAVVVFRDGGFKLEEYGLRGVYTESGYDECGGGWGILDFSPIDWYTLINLEVIGNIYDNPELLGG